MVWLSVQLRSHLSRIMRTAMKTTGSTSTTSSHLSTHALITYSVSVNMNGLMVYVHVAVMPVVGDTFSQIQLSGVTLLN